MSGPCTFSLWMPTALHLPFRYFPTNRDGASNTGDGSIPYGPGKPGIARSTPAVRRGSVVTTHSPAASPRPRHRSPLLAGQHASLLLVWTCRVWCPLEHRWRRRQSPVPLLRSGRDLSPPPSRTALPCGPRFSELLAAPLPLLICYSVRPGGVNENTGS